MGVRGKCRKTPEIRGFAVVSVESIIGNGMEKPRKHGGMSEIDDKYFKGSMQKKHYERIKRG